MPGKSLLQSEPILDMDDIQGLALPGFLKPHHTLIGLTLPRGPQNIIRVRKLLHLIASEVTSATATLQDRREYRRKKLTRGSRKQRRKQAPQQVLQALTFNSAAMCLLAPGAKHIPSEAFHQGLASRSALLGDRGGGSPRHWKFGRHSRSPVILIIVAGDSRKLVSAKAEILQGRFESTGCKLAYLEDGDIRPDLKGYEHFGFSDGISQPGIRGFASKKRNDFITPRYIKPGHPDCNLFGYPGQDLVWPGEFVLGYPKSSADPLVPGPILPCVPAWTRNGSFLVFRRLEQKVDLFWSEMERMANILAKNPAFASMNKERLAALLVGRWPSGAPVSRTPQGDLKRLGQDPMANNYIRFDSNCDIMPLRGRPKDRFPMSKADPLGAICPWSSHIRKLNTRDSSSDLGGRESTYTRRILRSGIPFGKPFEPGRSGTGTSADDSRGLLFLCLQASIEGQFEFLQARWLNDPSRPRMPGGHDFLVGQPSIAGGSDVRQCSIFGKELKLANISTTKRWTVPTGGGYFFVPSRTTLKKVLGLA